MLQNPDAVLKELAQKKINNIYFLHGEESFFIDKISDYIENNALTPAQKSFNQAVLYGKDTNTSQIITQAKRFPMMSEKQVIIVKELNQMDDWGSEASFKFWQDYIQKPLKSTILVLQYKHKTFNKVTKLYKLLEKNAIVVEAKKIYDSQVPSWVQNYLKEKKYQIEPKASLLLAEAVGAELSKLASELDKLMLNIPKEQSIKEDDIEKYVGISKEYNIFELQKSLVEKNKLKAGKILQYWEANPKKQPLIPTLAMLFSFFIKVIIAHQEGVGKSDSQLASALKIAPFAVKEYKAAASAYPINKLLYIVDLLQNADLQSKGVVGNAMEDAEILRELIFKILYS
jgi:DNA polymerase-3 subunit delta